MTTASQDILHEEEEFDYSQKIEIRKVDSSAPMRWLSKNYFKISILEDYHVVFSLYIYA